MDGSPKSPDSQLRFAPPPRFAADRDLTPDWKSGDHFGYRGAIFCYTASAKLALVSKLAAPHR
jgi:hypothetical protein